MVRLDLAERLAKPRALRFIEPGQGDEEVMVVLWPAMTSHVEELDLRLHDGHPTRCRDDQVLDRAANIRITSKGPRAPFNVFEEHIKLNC